MRVGVRYPSLGIAAPIRDLILVANGSSAFEDLLSVLLSFRLPQIAPTEIRMGCGRGGSDPDAYLSQHGAPGFLRVPYEFLLPRRGA